MASGVIFVVPLAQCPQQDQIYRCPHFTQLHIYGTLSQTGYTAGSGEFGCLQEQSQCGLSAILCSCCLHGVEDRLAVPGPIPLASVVLGCGSLDLFAVLPHYPASS